MTNLEDCRRAFTSKQEAQAVADEALDRLRATLQQAAREGIRDGQIAEALGVTRQRVQQLRTGK